MDRIKENGKKTMVSEIPISDYTQKLGTAGSPYIPINIMGQRCCLGAVTAAQ